MFKRFTDCLNQCRLSLALLFCILALPVAEARMFAAQASDIRDPQYGVALFDAYQQNYYSAIVSLLVAQEQQQLKHHQVDSQLLLGNLYVSYGLYTAAEKVFQGLTESKTSPLIHDRAWFYLGKLFYHKQLFPAAEKALGKVGDALDADLREELVTLKANLLMHKENYAEAADHLAAVMVDPLSSHLYFARYNLGVALIKSDRHREGVDVLRELGRLQTNDPELKLLRDKANLTLGFLVLQRAPVIARDFLRRIRLNGPFANRALLGLGWAGVQGQDYELALAPLTQLSQRGGTDIAVFDSMLMIGNILERQRAYPQAIQAYQEAITIYERELVALDAALATIKAGHNLDDLLGQITGRGALAEQGGSWEAQALPDSAETRYLFTLMAGDEFHEGLKNLRDLTYLSQKLQAWQQQIPVKRYLITQRQETFESRLKDLKPEDTLVRVTQLRTSRDSFAAELERISNAKDTFALANKKERALLDQLARLEQGIQEASGDKDAALLLERFEFLKGLLSYEIEIGYLTRYREAEQRLEDIDKLLEQTFALQSSLEQARDQTPQHFTNLRSRHDRQGADILALQVKVQEVFNDQKRQLQSLAESSLLSLRDKLREYLDRARLSLALVQDQVLSQQVPEAESNEVAR